MPRSTETKSRGRPAEAPKKLRREEKAENNRKALIEAAAEVIGERGYAEASITRITERAGLASGTFYRFFESRQALFDILLAEVAEDARRYIAPLVHGSENLVDLEERGLRGVLEWEANHPNFARIRSEAETAAPAAFAEYLQQLLSRYTKALKRGQSQGYLKNYSDTQIQAIASMLIGARHYLHYLLPEMTEDAQAISDAYISFVKGGLLTSLNE